MTRYQIYHYNDFDAELATHQLQQPMYVNMHELANLAASRAQEMQLPLPPPPASLTVPGTDKVREQEKKYKIYNILNKYFYHC